MRKFIWVILVLVVIVIGAALAIRAWVESYLRTELSALASETLAATLTFDDLSWWPPYTVEIKGVRLASGDQNLCEAEAVRFTLDSIPSSGDPLHLTAMELDAPAIRIGEGVSWGDVLRADAADALLTRKEGAAPNVSESIVVGVCRIRDGRLVWIGGGSEMTLERISFDVQGAPEPGEEDRYSIEGSASQSGLVTASIKGSLDLSDALVKGFAVTLNIDLDQEQYGSLPPQLQDFASEHSLHGSLSMTGSGDLYLMDVATSVATLSLTLTDGGAMIGDWQLPLSSLKVEARYVKEEVSIDNITADDLLGGTAWGVGTIGLHGAMPISLDVDGRDLRIASMAPKSSRAIGGCLEVTAHCGGNLLQPATLSSAGTISLHDGKLLNAPLVEDLEQAVEGEVDEVLGAEHGAADFTVSEGGVSLRNLDFIADNMGVRGKGQVNF
ncbi:MAG: hypothetical protein QGH76_07460, partial [Phycisphaerales bacterium]|nr:hypothetical protein [Phycisphaerales bacterium]